MYDDSRLMMPICGLSFQQIYTVAQECQGNKTRTAKRLGVDRHALKMAIDRHSVNHWFVAGRGKAPRPRSICVDRNQISELAGEGYIRKDVAYLLGISPGYLKSLIKRWDLSDSFIVRNGRASWIAKRGYIR